jgi:hypothetical protein
MRRLVRCTIQPGVILTWEFHELDRSVGVGLLETTQEQLCLCALSGPIETLYDYKRASFSRHGGSLF